MFSITHNSNEEVTVVINGKRYDYTTTNLARVIFLTNKYRKKPGKAFNEMRGILHERDNKQSL